MAEEAQVPQPEAPEPGASLLKSADAILDELFTELGSKKPTDSIVDFLGTAKKKKKKHKEKDKDKSKEKSKEKSKKKLLKGKTKTSKLNKKKTKENTNDKGENAKKRKKGEEGEAAEDEAGDKTPAKKRKLSESKSSKKSSHKTPKEDLEEGEIKEKDKEAHHKKRKRRQSSVEEHGDKQHHDRKHSRSGSEHGYPPASSAKHSDRKREDKHESHHHHHHHHQDSKHSGTRSGDPYNEPHHRHPSPRHGEGDRYDHSYDRGYDNNSKPWGNKESDYSERRRSPDTTRYDDRNRFDSRPSSRYFDNRRQSASGYDSDPNNRRRRYIPGQNLTRSRSRSRGRRNSEDVIDKVKLLEIARRNATLLMKKGVLPTDIFSKDQIMAIKAGGKSVEELTSYCRRIARTEKGGDGEEGGLSGNEFPEQEHFIHHPFVVKERPMPQITLNIRNAIPLPVRTPQALAIENAVRKSQFPVSSGCQHRFKELEWKEVDPEQDKKDELNKAKTETALEVLRPVGAVLPLTAAQSVEEPSAAPIVESEYVKADTGITLDPPELPLVDIASVVSARLKAIRTLKEDPQNYGAKKELENALVEMDQWAQAKALEPKFLTLSDLQSGPQAWAKRDQLKNAKEVASGMGMHLLQKMGWRPGEGLGKNKEGGTEPLALDVKTDKKGLSSQADLKVKGPQANISMLCDLSGKHPVSALMELCTKRRWGPPTFDMCFEHGPPHQKSFVYKVTVNGVEYQPCIATNNKKLAKANAAAFCLQSLGLLKTTAPAPSAESLQTVPPPGPVPPPNYTTEIAGMKMVSSHLLQTVPSNPF